MSVHHCVHTHDPGSLAPHSEQTDAPEPRLLDQGRDTIRRKHYSIRTEQSVYRLDLFSQQTAPTSGCSGRCAAVMVQDMLTEATLKIVRRKKNILMLEPANRRYKVLSFKGAERRRVAILGKLAGIVRRTR